MRLAIRGSVLYNCTKSNTEKRRVSPPAAYTKQQTNSLCACYLCVIRKIIYQFSSLFSKKFYLCLVHTDRVLTRGKNYGAIGYFR